MIADELRPDGREVIPGLDEMSGLVAAQVAQWAGGDHLTEAVSGGLLRSAMSFAAISVHPRVAAEARQLLTRLGTQLSPTDLTAAARRVAEVGRRATIVSSLHQSCTISSRTFVGVFTEISRVVGEEAQDPPPPVVREDDVASICTWLLGRISQDSKIHRVQDRLFAQAGDAEAQLVEDAIRHRMPGHSESRRRGHLRRLLADPDFLRDYSSFCNSQGFHPVEANMLSEIHDRLLSENEACYCSKPDGVYEIVFGNSWGPWVDVGTSGRLRRIIDSAAEASSPRVDVARVAGSCLVINLQGFTDAVFLAALREVGTVRASAWQESALAREARKMGSVNHALPNVSWVRDSTRPGSHAGEIDAMLVVDSVLLDFQAKAPNSVDFRKRSTLVSGGALSQHQDLREALEATGVTFVKQRRGSWTPSSQSPLTLGEEFSVHVPITVAVEPAPAWSVGGTWGGGIGRVTTNIDHIETVNRFVPDVLRPVYWVDRHMLEIRQDRRFVDEMDFLGHWYRGLKAGENQIRLLDNGLVMAEYHEIEQLVHFENMFPDASQVSEFSGYIRELNVSVTRGLATVESRSFFRLLRGFESKGTPGWLALAINCVGKSWSQVEEKIAARRSFSFNDPDFSWGMVFGSGDQGALRLTGLDCVVVVDGRRSDLWFNGGFLPAYMEKVRRGTLSRPSFLGAER